MRRLLPVIGLLAVLGLGGFAAKVAFGAGETTGTQTFTNVVTYTIPTVTVTVTDPGTTTASYMTEPFSDPASVIFGGSAPRFNTDRSYSSDPSFYSMIATGASGQAVRLKVTPTSGGVNVSNGEMTSMWLAANKSYAGMSPSSVRTNGQDTWYRFSIRFPAGLYHPSASDWNHLAEWHVSSLAPGTYSTTFSAIADGTSPGGRFYFRNTGGNYTAPTYTYYDYFSQTANHAFDIVYDHWYDVVMHFKWSTSAATGSYAVWIDGKVFVPATTASTLMTVNDGGSDYLTAGLYQYRKHDTVDSYLDYDEWQIGPSAASVGFTP